MCTGDGTVEMQLIVIVHDDKLSCVCLGCFLLTVSRSDSAKPPRLFPSASMCRGMRAARKAMGTSIAVVVGSVMMRLFEVKQQDE